MVDLIISKIMNVFHWFYRHKPGEHRVKYLLTGCKVIQEPHVKKGWKHSFTGHTGDYFFIAAQSNKPGSSVSLSVFEDGKLFSKVEKRGDYPIVEAFGHL